MASAAHIAYSLEHLEDVIKTLDKVSNALRRRILRSAISDGMRPLARTAKAWATGRPGPKIRTKFLHRSLGWRVKVYRYTGVVVGMVGARSGYNTTGRGRKKKRKQTRLGKRMQALRIYPTRYAHLVEFGHGGPRPAPAYSFLRRAWNAHLSWMPDRIARRIHNELAKMNKATMP